MPLSTPKGPFKISTLTLELPAKQTLPPSPFRAKGSDVDAFRLQTLLVTLFYPTASASSPSIVRQGKPLSWLNEPRFKAIEGLLKYGGLSRYLAYPAALVLPFNTKLPYGSDGPLADRSSTSESAVASATPARRWPVGIFSHGLAGSRTTYSAYCAELASQGMIIASVEHRDGSCPFTRIHQRQNSTPHDPNGKNANDLVYEDLVYRKIDELDATDDVKGEADIWEMRKAQLNLRQAEVLEALHLLKRINAGEGEDVAYETTRQIDASLVDLPNWKDQLDLNNVWALGHSFGGSTCIELLRKEDCPFTHSVVLDPWLEPLLKVEEGAPSVTKPLYVVNSEGFTVWRKHFAWLRMLVDDAMKNNDDKGWLITMTKTKHTDFSDFAFVMPRFFKPVAGGSAPDAVLGAFSCASQMQFTDSFDKHALGMPVRDERPDEVENRDLGEGGHIVWHPVDGAPQSDGKNVDASRL